MYWPTLIFSLILCAQYCFAQKFINATSVNINEIIDENMADVRRHIRGFGFDPMNVPNISDTIYAKIFFVNYSVPINLTNGRVDGAQYMERNGDFIVTFMKRSTIRVTAPIFIKELTGNFSYSYSAIGGLYADTGIMNTTIQNITATVSMDCKINTIQIFNPRLHLEKVGKIRVKMQSSGSFSAIKSLVANIAIPYYEEKIQSIAENTALLIAKKTLIYVNKNLYKSVGNALAVTLQLLGSTIRHPN